MGVEAFKIVSIPPTSLSSISMVERDNGSKDVSATVHGSRDMHHVFYIVMGVCLTKKKSQLCPL